jgi:hypothetical protein
MQPSDHQVYRILVHLYTCTLLIHTLSFSVLSYCSTDFFIAYRIRFEVKTRGGNGNDVLDDGSWLH